MAADWKAEDLPPVAGKKWRRSWRQEFFTELGEDFSLIAHLQDVTVIGDAVIKIGVGQVIRTASQVISDPRVQELSRLMTELIGEWEAEDEAARLVLATAQSINPSEGI